MTNTPELHPRSLFFLLIIFTCLSVTGCGTLSNGRGWGQDAIYPVDLKRICRAAHNAFFDFQTFVPAAGAMIFAIDDWDEKASDWASDHNPIFGSIDDAKDASDSLRNVLLAETIVTAFATPSGDDSKQWAFSKLKGLGVELAATSAAAGVTSLLKEGTGRTRPDNRGDTSFPSAHTTSAFSYSTLSNRNLDSIDMPKKVKRTLQVGNLLLATSVGWARIEGQRHYPSDVLAAAALAHFFTGFIHDAFLDLPENDRFHFLIFPKNGGAAAQLAFTF